MRTEDINFKQIIEMNMLYETLLNELDIGIHIINEESKTIIYNRKMMEIEMMAEQNKFGGVLSYLNPEFLTSVAGRPVRVLAEYLEPAERLRRARIRESSPTGISRPPALPCDRVEPFNQWTPRQPPWWS